MGSRAMVVLRAIPILTPPKLLLLHRSFTYGVGAAKRINRRCYSTNSGNGSSLQAPDVHSLAQTARISLTPVEVEEFGPKINQVIDCFDSVRLVLVLLLGGFGQLQAVDLESIDPAIRAETEGDNIREDIPEEFSNREAMIASIPSYNEPYIKVPNILNKE